MSKKLEVTYIVDKKGSFHVGDSQVVKMGYAINYLIPQNLAVLNTAANQTLIASLKKQANKRQEELKKLAEEVKPKLHDKGVTFTVKTNDEGTLYGSITSADIAEKLNAEFGTELDKYDVKVSPIKDIVTLKAPIELHKDVEITVTVDVKDENPKATKAKREAAEKKKQEEEAAAQAEAESAELDSQEDVAEETQAEAEETVAEAAETEAVEADA